MANEIFTNKFKSILDLNAPYKSILSEIGPEIEFSISSLLKNSAINTYFNILALEYYNYEYNQLLRLNDLKLKDENTGILNLTVLELVYNITYQIVLRRWRYSSYVAYDVYILPIRIQKYIEALDYKLKKYNLTKTKEVFRLVAQPTKHITQFINKFIYSERLALIFELYRTTDISDIETRLLHFKEIVDFLDYSWPISNRTFGQEFTNNIRNEIKILVNLNPKSVLQKDLETINKKMDRVISISMVIIMLIGENMENGVWDKIVEVQQYNQKRKEAEIQLKKINAELNIKPPSAQQKTDIDPAQQMDENGYLKINKIKQPQVNLNNNRP